MSHRERTGNFGKTARWKLTFGQKLWHLFPHKKCCHHFSPNFCTQVAAFAWLPNFVQPLCSVSKNIQHTSRATTGMRLVSAELFLCCSEEGTCQEGLSAGKLVRIPAHHERVLVLVHMRAEQMLMNYYAWWGRVKTARWVRWVPEKARLHFFNVKKCAPLSTNNQQSSGGLWPTLWICSNTV